mmetsp:Transcript_26323/g.68428  ORF Transcript_26323/g.68428 Transcript_26323/m.68428 type:complete len:231 (-) Transcript_26323:88-780(-)
MYVQTEIVCRQHRIDFQVKVHFVRSRPAFRAAGASGSRSSSATKPSSSPDASSTSGNTDSPCWRISSKASFAAHSRVTTGTFVFITSQTLMPVLSTSAPVRPRARRRAGSACFFGFRVPWDRYVTTPRSVTSPAKPSSPCTTSAPAFSMRAIAAASSVARGPIVAFARRSPASSPRRATAHATDSPFTSVVAALEAAAAMLEMERPTEAMSPSYASGAKGRGSRAVVADR